MAQFRQRLLASLHIDEFVTFQKKCTVRRNLFDLCAIEGRQLKRRFHISETDDIYTVTRLGKEEKPITPRAKKMEKLIIGQSIEFDAAKTSRYMLQKLCKSESLRQGKKFELSDVLILGTWKTRISRTL